MSGYQYQVASRWLWPWNRTFSEVASMVVTWWIVAFMHSVLFQDIIIRCQCDARRNLPPALKHFSVLIAIGHMFAGPRVQVFATRTHFPFCECKEPLRDPGKFHSHLIMHWRGIWPLHPRLNNQFSLLFALFIIRCYMSVAYKFGSLARGLTEAAHFCQASMDFNKFHFKGAAFAFNYKRHIWLSIGQRVDRGTPLQSGLCIVLNPIGHLFIFSVTLA